MSQAFIGYEVGDGRGEGVAFISNNLNLTRRGDGGGPVAGTFKRAREKLRDERRRAPRVETRACRAESRN